MAAKSLNLAGKQFVIVPRKEYANLKRKAGADSPAKTKRGKKPNIASNRLPPVEVYSDERIAEFLLSNSVGAEDYDRACGEVRKLGLDPARITHIKPAGIA